MPGEIDLETLKRQSFRRFEQDGLSELAGGMGCLLMSVFVIHIKSQKYAIGILVALLMAALFFYKIFFYLRKRIQAPRTGYAKFTITIPLKTRMRNGGLAMIVLLAALIIAHRAGLPDRSSIILMVVVLGLNFVYNYYRSGDRLYLGYAAFLLVSGIFAALIGHDDLHCARYSLLFFGVFFLVVGTFRMRLYLRRHPKIADEG